MNNKPRMYQNRINKEFHNNREIYTTYDKEDNQDYITNINDIRRKIESIINSRNFIYSKLVNIVIGNDIIKRKIIGINNNNLITIDNEYIPLENIKDIYV